MTDAVIYKLSSATTCGWLVSLLLHVPQRNLDIKLFVCVCVFHALIFLGFSLAFTNININIINIILKNSILLCFCPLSTPPNKSMHSHGKDPSPMQAPQKKSLFHQGLSCLPLHVMLEGYYKDILPGTQCCFPTLLCILTPVFVYTYHMQIPLLDFVVYIVKVINN